ncbi:MAG TPA: putative quinol monooxygenase [Rhizomicrobium sp.]|nr:putative quinol monooxygenase [Rhizomicrobium sp.]
MRKPAVLATAVAALFISLSSQPTLAQSQSPAPYVNLIELVIIPSELPKFLETAKENAAAFIKEPGVREFNITQLASNPNHIVFYEVYDNEAALTAHRSTDRYKKFKAGTENMIADRNLRVMASVVFHSKDH